MAILVHRSLEAENNTCNSAVLLFTARLPTLAPHQGQSRHKIQLVRIPLAMGNAAAPPNHVIERSNLALAKPQP